MGGALSRFQPDTSGPKSFYLLLGGPSIRYAKGATHGPLIFDVVPMQHSRSDAVEHAETLQTVCNVPTKQPFGLRDDRHGGYKLQFFLDCLPNAAPTSVKVLVSVKIDYREGSGLRIVPSDPENDQFCILEQKRFNQKMEIEFERMQSIRLDKLTPCPNTGELQAPRSLTACPIVIVVESDVYFDVDEGTDDERAAASVHKHVQYTFLNLSKDGVKKAQQGKHRSAEGDDGDVEMDEAQVIPLTLLKQYLQVDADVFELDDVYDLGGDAKAAPPTKAPTTGGGEDDAPAPADEEVGAEVDDVCVVCLSNPKDTTILPCRHMCLCSECAAQLRNATNKCPICRQQIGKLMTMHA